VADRDDQEKPGGFDRAEFVKRLAFGTFAVPAIASFKLDSLSRGGSWPGQSGPNQTYANQTYPNQTYPNQTYPNQTYPNQTYPPDPEARLLRLVFRLLGFGRGN
jgi:hypothetical protein